MKKMYKYILIITLMMFSFVGEVKAIKKYTMCEYKAKSNGDKIEIVYHTSGGYKGYNVYVNGDRKQKLEGVDSGTVFIQAGSLNEFTGECPINVYWSNKKSLTYNYCFDNNGKYCDEKHNYEAGVGKIELTTERKNVYKDQMAKEKLGSYVPPSAKSLDYSCLEDANCAPLCHYSFKKNSTEYDATIYYYKGKNMRQRYMVSASWLNAGESNVLNTPNIAVSNTYITGTDLLKLMDEGTCPVNLYVDPDGTPEICFDNNGGCKGESKFKDHELVNTTTRFFTDKDNYLKSVKEDRKYELTCEDAKKKIEEKFSLNDVTEICGYTKDKVFENNIKQFFVVTENNEFKFYKYSAKVGKNGEFVEITNTKDKNNVTYNDAYTCTAFKQFYTSDINENSQWRTDEDILKVDNMYLFTCNIGTPKGYDKIDNNITDCDSLLGEDLRNEINSWFLYIKIAVPIILIVMGSLDFGKAFISSDEDAMKKAQKRFIMRLIIAVVIFFIPTIVNALLNIGDQVWNITNGNGTCKVQF